MVSVLETFLNIKFKLKELWLKFTRKPFFLTSLPPHCNEWGTWKSSERSKVSLAAEIQCTRQSENGTCRGTWLGKVYTPANVRDTGTRFTPDRNRGTDKNWGTDTQDSINENDIIRSFILLTENEQQSSLYELYLNSLKIKDENVMVI